MGELITAKCVSRFVGTFYNYEYDLMMASVLRDSLSRGQLMSKLKLVEMVKSFPQKNTGLFIGHWHGLLPLLFYENKIIKSAVGIEADQKWIDFSNKLNSHWDWESIYYNADSFKNYEADIIVNTSCEHMSLDWMKNIPNNTIICAQSTDYDHETHINKVNSLEEFLSHWKDFNILKTDSTRYDVYSRFTVIAIKNDL